MATTTNFGWETPDDTDLVKDGALAMRTLGNAIDTSMVDLKGGTTGQVLSKATNTDMDFTWVTQDDANAIQNTIVDAKGDLISATAADTPARLAVGTNGQVLTADSSTSTGLKWAAPAAGSFVGCAATKTGNQSINNVTYTAVTFDAELFDTDSIHSTSTNTSRFTVPTGKGGKWMINIYTHYATAAGVRAGDVRKNGSSLQYTTQVPASNSISDAVHDSLVCDLSAADYVEFFAYQSSGSTGTILGGNYYSTVQFYYLGA